LQFKKLILLRSRGHQSKPSAFV